MRTFKYQTFGEEDGLERGIRLIARCREKYPSGTWCVLFQAYGPDVRGVVFESAIEAEIFMRHEKAAKKEIRERRARATK